MADFGNAALVYFGSHPSLRVSCRLWTAEALRRFHVSYFGPLGKLLTSLTRHPGTGCRFQVRFNLRRLRSAEEENEATIHESEML